tara:strand:+ start:3642 stop:3965 length:324 start_codon:yes stop_codon:yes gene_type:complete
MITVTNNAISRILEVNKKKNLDSCFFRISIDGGGCQGFSYKFYFEDKINDDDEIFEFNEVKILVDKTSLEIISGSKVDFVSDMMGSYFKIENPKASSTCGCGTSFSI